MKTIEEEAKDFAIMIQTKPDTASRFNAQEWFKAGIKFVQRYIPVEEELPQKATFVIVEKKNGLELGMYYNADGEFMYGENDQTREIVGWRPIRRK